MTVDPKTNPAKSNGTRGKGPDDVEDQKLRAELATLFLHLQRLRSELAAIKYPGDSDMAFSRMGNQLDAVVEATEAATNTIMESTESTEEIVNALRESDSDRDEKLNQILENGYKIMEACSFQDITGQRVSKVAKFVDHVEDRINSLIDIWGKDDIDQMAESLTDDRSGDEKLLAGPALSGEGVSQDDIDKMFS